MNDQKIAAVVAAVLHLPVDQVTDELDMDSVPEWDSLAQMNLVIALEDEFKVSIPDADAANMTSVPLIHAVLGELLQDQ